MKIRRMSFPESSILYRGHEKYDYFDSYGGAFSDPENKISIVDVLKVFSKPLPDWIDALMSVRDCIVSIVGLKTSEKVRHENIRDNYRFVEGEKVGFFNFYSRTENEIILGEDDKHLNFRVSLLLEDIDPETGMKKMIITTVVEYNNWMGRFYFFFVKPFHRVIVPATMKKDYSHFKIE